MSNRIVTFCGQWAYILLQNGSLTSALFFFIFDIIVALSTIICNSIFMITLIKTRSLHTPSNILLGALCFSDLLVGFIVQPITISFFAILRINHAINIPLVTALSVTFYICTGLSFLCIVLVSLDRYVAVCHPYKYHSLATCKTHIYLAIVATLIWICFAGTRLFLAMTVVFEIIRLSLSALCIIIVIFSYARIYKIISRHRRCMHADSVPSSGGSDTQARGRERRKSCTMAIIIGIFFVCYLPYTALYVSHLIRRMYCLNTQFVNILSNWSVFLVLLNSLLNPIVYYARSKEIKDAVLKVIQPIKRVSTQDSQNCQISQNIESRH